LPHILRRLRADRRRPVLRGLIVVSWLPNPRRARAEVLPLGGSLLRGDYLASANATPIVLGPCSLRMQE
jgi:hypothetical protein